MRKAVHKFEEEQHKILFLYNNVTYLDIENGLYIWEITRFKETTLLQNPLHVVF